MKRHLKASLGLGSFGGINARTPPAPGEADAHELIGTGAITPPGVRVDANAGAGAGAGAIAPTEVNAAAGNVAHIDENGNKYKHVNKNISTAFRVDAPLDKRELVDAHMKQRLDGPNQTDGVSADDTRRREANANTKFMTKKSEKLDVMAVDVDEKTRARENARANGKERTQRRERSQNGKERRDRRERRDGEERRDGKERAEEKTRSEAKSRTNESRARADGKLRASEKALAETKVRADAHARSNPDSDSAASSQVSIGPQYCPGDLLWSKIGQCTFWPCMVIEDPIDHRYYRLSRNYVIYYVQYFGTEVTHGWTMGPSRVVPYKGLVAFKIYAKEIMSKTKVQPKFYDVDIKRSPEQQVNWETALREIEEAAAITPVWDRYNALKFNFYPGGRKRSEDVTQSETESTSRPESEANSRPESASSSRPNSAGNSRPESDLSFRYGDSERKKNVFNNHANSTTTNHVSDRNNNNNNNNNYHNNSHSNDR